MTKIIVLGDTLINGGGSKQLIRAAVLCALAVAGHDATAVDASPIRYAEPPIDCRNWNTKKTKGDKRRDRAERRRKWGI